MSERLSTAEVAKATGIPEPTIKHWLGKLPEIPAEKDSQNRWRFTPEALEVLAAVKDLRDQDRTFDTIRRVIGEPEPSASQAPANQPSSHDEPQSSADERPLAVDERSLAEGIAAVIVPQLAELADAMSEQAELAEKYARAAHQIGTLEERVRGLEAERDRLAGELAETRKLLAAPKAYRPWWKVWG